MPFFGEYDYETVQNGPIWIMGTPLFYEYEVHYVGASALDTGFLTPVVAVVVAAVVVV